MICCEAVWCKVDISMVCDGCNVPCFSVRARDDHCCEFFLVVILFAHSSFGSHMVAFGDGPLAIC